MKVDSTRTSCIGVNIFNKGIKAQSEWKVKAKFCCVSLLGVIVSTRWSSWGIDVAGELGAM